MTGIVKGSFGTFSVLKGSFTASPGRPLIYIHTVCM